MPRQLARAACGISESGTPQASSNRPHLVQPQLLQAVGPLGHLRRAAKRAQARRVRAGPPPGSPPAPSTCGPSPACGMMKGWRRIQGLGLPAGAAGRHASAITASALTRILSSSLSPCFSSAGDTGGITGTLPVLPAASPPSLSARAGAGRCSRPVDAHRLDGTQCRP